MKAFSTLAPGLGLGLSCLATAAAAAPPAAADLASYYVGIHDLATIAIGTYAGLPNPNFGRLTMLYAHPSDE